MMIRGRTGVPRKERKVLMGFGLDLDVIRNLLPSFSALWWDKPKQDIGLYSNGAITATLTAVSCGHLPSALLL